MDKDVDLTLDKKFSRLAFSKGDKTSYFKRYGVYYNDLYFKKSQLLPWNKRVNQISSDKIRKIRNYDDVISDEFGATIRFSEDNTMLSFGDRITYPEVIEEFFMEIIGRIPYSNINICMRCGRKSIKHMTSFMFSECGNHTRIPRKWEIDL